MRRGVATKRAAPHALACGALVLVVLTLGAADAQAATLTPTRLDDPAGPGACPTNCSLRQAIAAAGAGGTVSLQGGAYKLTLGVIALGSDVTISGPGAASTSVSAGGLSQVFSVTSGAHVTISGVTLTGGVANASPPTKSFGGAGGRGGAIANAGVLTLSRVDLVGNSAAGGAAQEETAPSDAGSQGEGGAIANSGLLTIEGGTMTGNVAHGGSALNGKGETAVFDGHDGEGGAIEDAGTLVVSGTTFSANTAEPGTPGNTFGSSGGEGGAISATGPVRISGSTFNANATPHGSEQGGEGGAIVSFSSLRVSQSAFTGNVADGAGGIRGEGGAIQSFGSATIDQSALSGNAAQGSTAEGGAINSFGALTLTADTLSANTSAGDGGAIESFSSLEASNSTIADNTAATAGGGLQNFGSTSLANDTLVANTASAGKGGNANNNGSAFMMHDTLIAQGVVTGGAGGENCSGTGNFVSAGYNLEDRDQCGLNGAGDQVNVVSTQLGALASNGGPTQTIALLAGSAAIDAGDPAGCTNTLGERLTTDQRGVSRPQGARCDIGAYELVQPQPLVTAQPITIKQPPPMPPALSGLKVSPTPFRAASSGATIAKAKASGASISYTDTVAATTTFKILRSAPGVRSGRRCVAPPRRVAKGRRLKRCTRTLTLATFSHVDKAGPNKLRFSGRVHGKKLAPGSYTLSATPALNRLVGRTATARFAIKR